MVHPQRECGRTRTYILAVFEGFQLFNFVGLLSVDYSNMWLCCVHCYFVWFFMDYCRGNFLWIIPLCNLTSVDYTLTWLCVKYFIAWFSVDYLIVWHPVDCCIVLFFVCIILLHNSLSNIVFCKLFCCVTPCGIFHCGTLFGLFCFVALCRLFHCLTLCGLLCCVTLCVVALDLGIAFLIT